MLKFYLAALLALIILPTVFAQTGQLPKPSAALRIRGRAVDENNGGGVGAATVQLLSAKDSALVARQVTDIAGAFELGPVPDDVYILLVLSMRHEKLYKPVPPESGPVLDMGLLPLSGKVSGLREVTITGTKPAFQRLANKLVLNIAGNQVFAASGNVFDLLKKVPGLTVGGDGTILMSGRITPAVFIDGRPVPMSPEELQNFLSTLTPGMIASIEVISNPTGQYDGEYKGIIDIRLKRDETLGWKGSLNTSLQRNSLTLSETALSASYKTSRLVYSARANYTVGHAIRRYKALQHLANTNIMATNTETITKNNSPGLQLGLDYSIRSNQRLGLQLRASRYGQGLHAYNTLYTVNPNYHEVSHTESDNRSTPLQRNYGANLSYSLNLKQGGQLDVLTSVLSIANSRQEDIQNKSRYSSGLLSYWKTAMKNDILVRMMQADFVKNAWKGKFGAGGKFVFTTTKNDLRYDTLGTTGEFAPDDGRSNNFRYREYIYAAYVNYSGHKNKLSYDVGLRAEHTHSIAHAITINELNTRNYLTWLPSVNLTYAISANRQVNLTYSRRITRPAFGQLNPFRFYFSPLNYWVGNPNLQPSTTSMLSLAFTQKAFNITLQAGRESDPMTRYPEYDSATNILQYLGRNLPYNDFAAVEISFPLTITKWWRMQHQLRGAYKKEQTPYHGVTYAIAITDYSISGSQQFTLPYAVTFDISYYRQSASGNGLYYVMPTGNADVGLQKSWLKGALNSRVNFYDIFDTQRTALVFREKRIINNQLEHWFGSRRLAVSLTYSFGRSTYKGRQGVRNEEERRAGF